MFRVQVGVMPVSFGYADARAVDDEHLPAFASRIAGYGAGAGRYQRAGDEDWSGA